MTPEPSPALERAEKALRASSDEDPAERVRALEGVAAALDAALAEDAG